MDIFKFTNPSNPSKMEQGEIINGLSSKMWIERYRDAGEFTLTAPVSVGLGITLPVGTFISHTDTDEIMVVENIEINEDQESEAVMTITGRGYETQLEQRIVGSNNVFPTSGADLSFELAANYTWVQAENLIKGHIYASELEDSSDALPYITALNSVSGTSESIDRAIQRGYLYERLMELLAIDDLGIKIIRPSVNSPLGPTDPNVAFLIHVGEDLSADISFSYDTGEIVTADYLYSNKAYKTSALVSGTYVETVVHLPGLTELARRWMFLEAKDIDGDLTEAPVGPAILPIAAKLEQRGLELLKSQKFIILNKAEISKESTRAQYRTDFNVGDYITVNGDYNVFTKMRVTEYVEIEDENGSSGYPTLDSSF